jgi:tetratricopeptide (TPR) repeat protein
MQAHLSPETMTRLLSDRLTASESADGEAHLRLCPDCRTKLDELTATAPTLAFVLRPPTPASLSLAYASGYDLAPPGFELLELLGVGKTATVYRARQTRLGRVVALKVLLGGWPSEEEAQRRFQAEIEAAASQNHPHVVQVFEVGTHAGRPFLVMEYCAGGSLAERLRNGPLPANEAASILEVLARTLAVVHGDGFVHRDLKPANILFDGLGHVKITDFGIVKRLAAADLPTPVGSVLGTPPYLAPEQIDGSIPADPRCDLYALGAILYECLVGRPPFRAECVADALFDVLTREPLPPRLADPRLPRDLETICLKCLHKEPARRYATALELAEDLHLFREGLPVKARRIGTLGRAWRWGRRNPLPAILAAALTLSIVVGLALCGQFWYQSVESRLETEAARREAEEHFLRTRRLLPDLVAAGNGPWQPRAERRQVRREALQRACGFYRELCRAQPSERELSAELAQVLTALAEVARSEGRFDKARRDAEEASHLWRKLRDEAKEDVRARKGLAESLMELALVENFFGHSKEMTQAYRESIALSQRLAEDYPQDEQYLVMSVTARVNLSGTLFGEGNIDESISLLQENRRRLEEYLKGRLDAPHVRLILVETLFRLGFRHAFRYDKQNAIECWRAGCERGERLTDFFPQDPRAWYFPIACARLLPPEDSRSLSPAKALLPLEQTVRRLEGSYALNPEADGGWDFLVEVSQSLAACYLDAGRPADALRAEQRAAELMPNGPPRLPFLELIRLEAMAQLARREEQAGQTEAARRHARQVADGFLAFCRDRAADPALLGAALDYTPRLAPPLRHAGATDQSRRLVERALRLARQQVEANSDAENMRRLSEVWLQLAKVRMRDERDGVVAALTEAVSAARRFAAFRPENRYLLEDRLARLARFSRER